MGCNLQVDSSYSDDHVAFQVMELITSLFVFFQFLLVAVSQSIFDWTRLNLVENHIPYMFYNQPKLKDACLADESCPYKVS